MRAKDPEAFLGKRVATVISRDEFDRLVAAARADRRTVSGFMRAVLVGHLDTLDAKRERQ